MSKAKPKAVDAWAWLTKTQAAAVTGYSVRNFSERLQPRLGADATRGKGATLRFDIRAVGKALADHVAEQHKPKPEDVDPLLGTEGQTSDALEEFRRESTEKLKLANAATRRELVDRTKVLAALMQGFGTAAAMGKKLQLQFGKTAVQLWNQGVEAQRKATIAALGETVTSDGNQ